MLSGTVPSTPAPSRPNKATTSAQKSKKRERSVERFQPPHPPTSNVGPSPPSMAPPAVQLPLPEVAATHISKSAKPGGATPSLASILTAYKKDGNGDRTLLVALLEAKRREDERLAARDVLAAEQLRAQNLHYAFYLASQYPPPCYPPPPSQHPRGASSHGGSSPRSRSGSVVSSATASTYTNASSKRRRSTDGPVTREEAMQALRGKIARSADGSNSPPRVAVVPAEADELDEDEDEDESEAEPLTPPRDSVNVEQGRKAPQGKNFAMLLNAVDQERRGLDMAMVNMGPSTLAR